MMINGLVIYDKIICPYCNKIFKNSIDYIEKIRNIIKCENCKKYFEFRINISIKYLTQKNCEINEKRHIYIKSGNKSDELICKNCGKQKIKKNRRKNVI